MTKPFALRSPRSVVVRTGGSGRFLVFGIAVTFGIGVARAETLERTISREDPKFACATAALTLGGDGDVYLCSAVSRGGYVLQVGRDGTRKRGGEVVWDGLANATANAAGVVATANGHFQHAINVYDRSFRRVAGCADFDGSKYECPTRVEAGASGDFYAVDRPRYRILRVSPLGALVQAYTVPTTVEVLDFRVCEKTEEFLVRGQDGQSRSIGFDGEVRWTRGLPGPFAMDAAGKIYVLDKNVLTTIEHDELLPEEMIWSAAQVKLPAAEVAGAVAIAVAAGDVVVRRPHPAELFRVYDLATGRLKKVVHAEHESVAVEFDPGPWKAGGGVPFRIRSSNQAAEWRVWAATFGDDDWREWKRSGDRLEVPADVAGLRQIRVAPALDPLGGGEFVVRTVVEVRAADGIGTAAAWTPLNRVWWGRGEEIPAEVAVRTKGQPPSVTLSLTAVADGTAAGAGPAPQPVWSADMNVSGDRPAAVVVPAALTARLAPGRYELRPQAAGLTCVPQPIRIGPGAAAKSPFRVTLHGDYANFNSAADAWGFADVADEMLARSLRLGVNQYVNRVTDYRYPLAFADAADGVGLLRAWERRLAAAPDGVPPQKVGFGFAQAHALGGFGANGIREWLLLVRMDAALPLGTPTSYCGPITAEWAEQTIAAFTGPLRQFPAFQGWDWAANWWVVDANRRFTAPEKPAQSAATPKPGDSEAIDADEILGETDEEARNRKPPPPSERQLYDAALKKAVETGAWDPLLDTVDGRKLGWQADAQQVFGDALRKVAAGLSTASAGPYRRPEVYPPTSFANVDEVDLHYQAENFTTPNWASHAADYYGRPGKPAWIHPELTNDTGTGEMILPFSWMALMRGVDGIGVAGDPLHRPVYRSLNAFATRYGPWLTTLANNDRVAIVVSRRQVGQDGFGSSFGGRYFTRLWEAHQCCLHARHPATFLFPEDIQPGTLDRFRALLVVGQQFEPEPPLAELLARAKREGVALFADGTCRESLVRECTPLGVSFDHVEKLNGFNNENAFSEFPEAILAVAPAVAAKLDAVVPPVATVDEPEVLVSERMGGDGRFVWVVNNSRSPLGQGLLWRVGSGISSRRPVVAGLTLPVAKGEVVYEVFDGKPVAAGPLRADLRYTGARLYAVLPREIGSLDLALSAPPQAGEAVGWTASIPGIESPLPVHVELRDAAGALLDERFTTTGTGGLVVPVNARMPVSLAATELISGRRVTGGGATGDTAPGHAPPAALFGPRLRDCAISADGGTAVVSSFDWGRNLHAIDLATGRPRWSGTVGDHFAYAAVPLPGGYAVQGFEQATAEGYHLYRLDDGGRVDRRFAVPGIPARRDERLSNFAVPADGKWIAAAGNLALAVWAADGKLLWSQDWSAKERTMPRLLAAGNDRLVVARGTTLAAFEATTGREAWSLAPSTEGEIVGLAANADGTTVVARASTRSGRVFVVRDGRLAGTLATAADAAAVSPDGSWVAVTAGRELKLYRADGGLRWTYGADDPLVSLRLSPDGRRLAACSHMGTLLVVDAESGAVRSLDLGSAAVPAWTPGGDLVVATWMGSVARFDATLREQWRVNLAAVAGEPSAPAAAAAPAPVTAPSPPTSRLTSWSNAEPAVRPLVPNLLASGSVAVRAINGGSAMPLAHPPALLFDGRSDPPPGPWLSWGSVCSIDFWRGPFSLEIDASPARLRVKAVSLVEDAAHPESWMRDARLEYWDPAKNAWIFAAYLSADSAAHSHALAKPVEASKFRFTRPDGPGWPVGSLRLGEIVFHGEALPPAAVPPPAAAPQPVKPGP